MEQIETWLSVPRAAKKGWPNISRLAIYYQTDSPIARFQGNGTMVPVDIEQIPTICERLMNEYKFWKEHQK